MYTGGEMPTVFEDKKKHISVSRDSVVRHTIMTPLTSFAVSPDGVAFETQEQEETIVLFLRQHIIILFGPALLTALLAVTPVFVFPFLFRQLTLPIVFPVGYAIVGTACWYVATFGFALMSFLRWFFNIYIVTDRRIVDIDFIHLLYKEFSEARLERIQDISYKSGGIFAAFFDFGNVDVQTAGEMPNLEFSAVPHPARVVETISDLLEQHKPGI